MKLQATDEETLRRYLLGEMSESERTGFEMELMSDSAICDFLEAAEDDLIDDSLSGRLSQSSQNRFERHFLAAPERQRKLRFARSLRRFLADAPLDLSIRTPERKSTYRTVLEFLYYRPALGCVVLALVAVAVIAGTASAFRLGQIRQDQESMNAQVAALQRSRDVLSTQLEETRTLSEMLQGQFRAVEESLLLQKSSAPRQTTLTLDLLPGITRSSDDIPSITLLPQTAFLESRLVLIDDAFEFYDATLADDNGHTVWMRDHLTAVPTGKGKAVMLPVPGHVLAEGSYHFALRGLADGHPPENVATFHFRVVRQ